MDLQELVNEAHLTAREKGWWDIIKSPLEIHALIHSEVSEAVEEARGPNAHFYIGENEKPEGEAVELVDAIIRIADYFGYMNWDINSILGAKLEYNKTRAYRHGNKRY